MTRVVVPNHAETHCPGGPDPIPCLTQAPYAYLDGILCDITSGGWRDVTTDEDYDEGFESTPDDAGFTLDLAAGSIRWNSPGEYLATGWVLFGDTFSAGDVLGAAIDLGTGGTFGTVRVGNTNVATADGVIDEVRIPVQTPIFSFNPPSVGHDSVRLLAYQNSGSTKALIGARLHVVRLTPNVTGTFLP